MGKTKFSTESFPTSYEICVESIPDSRSGIRIGSFIVFVGEYLVMLMTFSSTA